MITVCKNCLNLSTRPRITFDDSGFCNACVHHENKKKVVWSKQWGELKALCDKFRRNDGRFDCIVPCSGGKDSSAIAYKFKHELGMHPLTVTFSHPTWSRIGWTNWNNFVNSGFDNILITPNQENYRQFNKEWFVKRGMPKQAFVVGISTAVIRVAVQMGIKFICFAEEGESEYGGKSVKTDRFTRDFLINIYYEGQDDSEKHGSWWKIPTDDELRDIHVTWISRYWNWDPQENAIFAKNHCGMEMTVGGNIGTFSNYAQNDDTAMQGLHCFLAFCKFGSGRCRSDACIEIRWGRMTREQGFEVVQKLDGQYPVEFHELYLDYFEMSDSEFWETVKRHVNWDILRETGNIEKPFELIECV